MNKIVSPMFRERVDKGEQERRKDDKGFKKQGWLRKDCEKGLERKNQAEKDMYTVYCILCTVYYIQCTVHCLLCAVYCSLCFVYDAL